MSFVAWVLALAACSGGAPYGEPCQRDADCAGDLTCPPTPSPEGALCTWTCDASDAYACPDGYSCLSSREVGAIGRCLKDCAADADCPADRTCNGTYCAAP